MSVLVYGEVIEYFLGFADFSLRRNQLNRLTRSVHTC